MIPSFFENISYRLNNENDLSDIIWAMCNTSPKFKEAFLSFFFPDIVISPEVEIKREVTKDDSRPDFTIHNNGDLYLIENKIYDRNQHFGQYDKVFGVEPEKFGYIANYVILQPEKDKHYQIRTWEEFYFILEKVEADNEQEQSLIDGFRLYLKNVCSILEYNKPMNIEGIFSLYQLMEVLIKLCKREEDNFILEVCNKDRMYNNSHADHYVTGVNFEIKINGSNIQSWGWIGIYFSKEVPTICIGFYDKENWGKTICNLIDKAIGNIQEGIYCTAPYYEDDAYWFEYIDGKDTYEESFNKLTLNEQIDELKRFMDEVLNLVCNLSKNEQH